MRYTDFESMAASSVNNQVIGYERLYGTSNHYRTQLSAFGAGAQGSGINHSNIINMMGMQHRITGPYDSDSMNVKLAAAKKWLKERS